MAKRGSGLGADLQKPDHSQTQEDKCGCCVSIMGDAHQGSPGFVGQQTPQPSCGTGCHTGEGRVDAHKCPPVLGRHLGGDEGLGGYETSTDQNHKKAGAGEHKGH